MGPLSVTRDAAYAHVVVQAATFADDDGALARRILAAAPGRDAAAESELCRRFAPRIRLYGLRHLRSEAAAADLIQDVLIMTLQKLRAGEVREPERLASFILGTCRQRVIDARRGGDRPCGRGGAPSTSRSPARSSTGLPETVPALWARGSRQNL